MQLHVTIMKKSENMAIFRIFAKNDKKKPALSVSLVFLIKMDIQWTFNE